MSHQNFLTTAIRKKDNDQLQSKEGIFLVEKRKNPRISVELPFDYSLVERGEAHRGMVADASVGGILVYLLEKIEMGALLRIEIFFAKRTELTTITAIAKVVWSDLAAKESWAKYRYGLQFLSFFAGDLNRLKILLKEIGKTHRQ